MRLLSEYAFTSGAAILNRNPFQKGDIGWIKDYPDHATPSEVRRLCILHYMLQMMYRGDPRQGVPSVLSIPISVGGASWLTALIVVDGKNDEALSGAFVVDSSEFQSRFLIYHSLLRDFEADLRKRSKDAYVRSIARAFIEIVERRDQIDNKSRRSGKTITLRADSLSGPNDFDDLDDWMLALCRIYPYDLVFFSNEENRPPSHAVQIRSLGDACAVNIGMRVGWNPYFDRFPIYPVLNPDQVSQQMRDTINATVGLGAWTRDKFKVQ